MLFKIILFFLCLHPLLLTSLDLDQNAQHSKGIIPSWVKPHDFPIEIIPLKPSQINFQHLLIDTQRNWKEKTLYRHYAVRVLTKSGVESFSQLNIDFGPSHHQVIVHAIRIFRGGEWLDRLETSRYNVIQRETELEQNLYNGDLTLIYFLDDVREGDVIEYSYSLVGQEPFFASHYMDMIYLQRDHPVERIAHRFLCPPDFSFLIKPINTTIEPQIIDISPSLREWSWEVAETSPISDEPDQPIWYNPPAHIETSQYKTWGELAQKIYPLFTLPPDFDLSISSEMRSLVEKWKESTKDLPERALLALRFVQDEVRYLGFMEGMGSFQPTHPNVTFQRRFGDCKDKTFLLHTLLRLMDIPSKPLLVHSSRGKTLPDALPNPFLFDHIVLQIEIDNKTYWAESTLSLQGGFLETTFFPNYEWGLLLSNDTEMLSPLPSITLSNPVEIDASFVLESEDFASLKMKSSFYGSKADRFRRSVAWRGLKKISEEFLSEIQEAHGAVTLNSPIEVLDDRKNNVLTFIETYRIPTQKLSDKNILENFSYTLRNHIHNRINPERSSPYAIGYPFWIKEHIHIKNPFTTWKPLEETYTKEHASLLYTLFTRINRHDADFDIELKHLQDHVPQTSFRDYWNILNEIDQKSLPKMDMAFLSKKSAPLSTSLLYSIALVFVWTILYLLFRKKLPTQDWLSFYLQRFQRFYSVITILSVFFIVNKPSITPPTILGMTVIVSLVCDYILSRKSIKITLALQIFVVLQIGFSSYLIFTKEDVELIEKLLSLAVCYLYLVSSLAILNKIKIFLLVEKSSSASISQLPPGN